MNIPFTIELSCSICLEPYKELTQHDAVRLGCQHAFGRKYIQTWASQSTRCLINSLWLIPSFPELRGLRLRLGRSHYQDNTSFGQRCGTDLTFHSFLFPFIRHLFFVQVPQFSAAPDESWPNIKALSSVGVLHRALADDEMTAHLWLRTLCDLGEQYQKSRGRVLNAFKKKYLTAVVFQLSDTSRIST